MFRFEKDMIPVLKENLSRTFSTEYFVEEFASGIGIADLVFTTKLPERTNTLVDFEAIYYMLNYLNIRNQRLIEKELVSKYKLKKDKFSILLQFLRESGYIKEFEGGVFSMNKYYKPCLSNLFSVEAKLEDWKQGYFQALRYKNYSHKSYLAISSKYVHRVDKDLLKSNNIGLISVSLNDIEIIINPKKTDPINKVAYYYLAENFVSKFYT